MSHFRCQVSSSVPLSAKCVLFNTLDSVSLYTQSTYVLQLVFCFKILSNMRFVLIFFNKLISRSMMHVTVFVFFLYT